MTDIALPRSPTYTTITKPFCAHFAQFLSSLAFDKKTSALRRSFLVPTFVYRHRFISLLVIRRPVSYMTEVRRRAGRLLGLHSITSSARASSEWGTVEPKRVGSLEVDHQLVLGRRLHWQVGRLLALENAIHVPCRAPILVDDIGSVRNQATGADEVAERIDRRQFVLSRECDDYLGVVRSEPTWRHSQPAVRMLCEGRNAALDLAGIV